MKRKFISVFLILILLAITTMPTILAATSTEKELEELKDKVSDAKEEQKEIADEKKSVLEEISDLDEQIEDYETEISKLNKKIDSLKKDITAKEKEITKLEKDFKEKEQAFLDRMVALYEAGQTTYLDMLLSSDSIVSFISSYYMIEEIATADKTMMDSIKEQQDKIEKAKKELEEQKTDIAASRNEVSAKQAKLNSSKSAKQSKVNSLSAEEKKLQAVITQFNAEIKKAEAEIEAARKKSEGYVGSFSGTLSWPVSTSSANWNIITSGYGKRDQPTAGASTNHKALDIGVRYTTVYAAADGYVSMAQRVSGYGNFIMIKHSNNLYTCYAHLNSYKVKAGQTVKRGQAIAVSGNTGVTTGPHLHFEVRTNGSSDSRVNPLNYISNDIYSKLKFW